MSNSTKGTMEIQYKSSPGDAGNFTDIDHSVYLGFLQHIKLEERIYCFEHNGYEITIMLDDISVIGFKKNKTNEGEQDS